jgi:hypothetical protein
VQLRGLTALCRLRSARITNIFGVQAASLQNFTLVVANSEETHTGH